tara:strand:- start:2641 stop:3216 length:576 start_codon:yes stop_codon:yes gene_type:complete
MAVTKTEALNWLRENEPSVYYLRESQKSLSNDVNLRDLGKLFADPNEHIQKDWVNENTKLNVEVRDDFEDDANAAGYDLYTTDGVLTIQSKLRARGLHLEQTRRKSKKNENSSSTGHVRYSVGEADVYLFSRPDVEDYLNIGKWNYIAIPERFLVDKENPKYLVPRVNKSIWKNFIGRATEILEEEYDRKK